MSCDARILVVAARFSSDGLPRIANCQLETDHAALHVGEMTRPIITHTGEPNTPEIAWAESDRRTFRGELEHCPDTRCVCPSGHRGDHAY